MAKLTAKRRGKRRRKQSASKSAPATMPPAPTATSSNPDAPRGPLSDADFLAELARVERQSPDAVRAALERVEAQPEMRALLDAEDVAERTIRVQMRKLDPAFDDRRQIVAEQVFDQLAANRGICSREAGKMTIAQASSVLDELATEAKSLASIVDSLAIDANMETILYLLFDRKPRTLTIDQISGHTRLGRDAVRAAINRLSDAHLCSKPISARKGWGLTASGVSLATIRCEKNR